jgi:hypothetical protein
VISTLQSAHSRACDKVAVGTGAFNILVSCDNSPKDLPRDAYDSAPVSVVPS